LELADLYRAGALYLTGSVARAEDTDEARPNKPLPSDIDFWTPEWFDDPGTNYVRSRDFLAAVKTMLTPAEVDIRPMGPAWPLDGRYLEAFKRDAIHLSCFLRPREH
jgi:hypothetical protein